MYIIAYLTMIIDHVCKTISPHIQYSPKIGRLAFPIFAYLLVQGLNRTKARRKYIMRLFACAMVSQMPFVLMLYKIDSIKLENGFIQSFFNIFLHFTQTFNVCFTLLIGALAVYFIKGSKSLFNNVLAGLLAIYVAEIMQFDYGAYGIILIFIFAFSKTKLTTSINFILATIAYVFFYSITPEKSFVAVLAQKSIQLYAILALPIIFLVKQEKATGKWKLLKYSIYPLHMLIIFIIRYAIFHV